VPKRSTKYKEIKPKIRNNATPNVLPKCCQFAQNQEPRAWLVASFWFEQRPAPIKALVSTLSHQNEVQNNNYSLGFKAKTTTKPAPKNKTAKKTIPSNGVSTHTLKWIGPKLSIGEENDKHTS